MIGQGYKMIKKDDIYQFKKIPASKRSISFRRLVYGVGVNDADYMLKPTVNGRRECCPFYQKWKSMLERCYSDKNFKKYPSYIGCTVCYEWLIFSKFKSWMENQDWKGKQLDKDIRVKGNKIYSPETCSFVSHAVNTIEGTAKHYTFINPYGDTVKIYNLNAYCQKNGLCQSHMVQVHKEKEQQHKGWRSLAGC